MTFHYQCHPICYTIKNFSGRNDNDGNIKTDGKHRKNIVAKKTKRWCCFFASHFSCCFWFDAFVAWQNHIDLEFLANKYPAINIRANKLFRSAPAGASISELDPGFRWAIQSHFGYRDTTGSSPHPLPPHWGLSIPTPSLKRCWPHLCDSMLMLSTVPPRNAGTKHVTHMIYACAWVRACAIALILSGWGLEPHTSHHTQYNRMHAFMPFSASQFFSSVFAVVVCTSGFAIVFVHILNYTRCVAAQRVYYNNEQKRRPCTVAVVNKNNSSREWTKKKNAQNRVPARLENGFDSKTPFYSTGLASRCTTRFYHIHWGRKQPQ